ncbi:hypothetical protein EV14_0355 [Prochlorococcus sp. MIT 0703]|nr:hypothetical protein EV14_0355 [Prochlorococcus sp. MIT 0703]
MRMPAGIPGRVGAPGRLLLSRAAEPASDRSRRMGLPTNSRVLPAERGCPGLVLPCRMGAPGRWGVLAR